MPFCYGSPADQSSSSSHNLVTTRSKIWRGRQVLSVFFMNEELIYKQKWTVKEYYTKQLTVEKIMEWAGVWNSIDVHSVPDFETVAFHQADIRIKFSSMYHLC